MLKKAHVPIATSVIRLATVFIGIRTFELSTIQAVHEDKVHTLQRQVLKLEDQVDNMMDKDKEIMDQHKKLFEILDKDDAPTGYSYN